MLHSIEIQDVLSEVELREVYKVFGLLSCKAVKGMCFKHIIKHLPHACQCVLPLKGTLMLTAFPVGQSNYMHLWF